MIEQDISAALKNIKSDLNGHLFILHTFFVYVFLCVCIDTLWHCLKEGLDMHYITVN